MFRRFILWLSHLWAQLCEFTMPSRRITQTPSTPAPPGAVATTPNPQTQPTFVSASTPTSQTPSTSAPNAMASTTASQTQLTLVSSSTPTEYHVFLSFRGKDTRLNFTDHLYDKLDSNGIRTYMDDPELRSGEVISDALLAAIRNSKTYIVVFSENYADSPWCLNELVEILNCHKAAQRSVIPVFYKIDPSVVRRQTGSFEQAFEKHQKRGEREKLENWQLTLKEVADFSGHHVSKDRSEAGVINKIVGELLLKINPKTLPVTKYPVGLDFHVEAITRKLTSDTKGIKFGIYGMPGVGKTTLAKALFNQLLGGGSFKGSSFLANVREISETTKGLVSLQQQLINDVLCSTKTVKVDNVEHGIKLIKDRICSAKVLVLIDDIYDLEQYESLAGPFASGSVVIITTRDEEMLEKVSVEPKYRYMLKVLDDAQSRELFTKHAFEKAEPTNNLLALCEDILGLAGGLPLALQIFGSYLSIKKEEGWKSYIETLQQNPNSTIEQKLSISLDALERDDRMLKKIFIDIACFFVGWNNEKAVEVLETYYSHADEKMDTLKKRCLLTVNEEKLEMHDLLRDVGRNVARNKAPDEPGKYSRLWLPKDIEDVLKNHKGTEAVEGIIPSNSNFNYRYTHVGKSFTTETFTTETFKWMRKLRFLYFEKVNLTGSFERMFEDLRVLHWGSCPLKCLPSEFQPSKLVILELPYSKLRTVWDQNMVTHVFGMLKTLNMSHSEDLVATPDFISLPSLETLNLECCQSLEEVHISIGSLARLGSLNLEGCVKLRSLPDTIYDLRALKVLNISKCYSLEALPLQLGNIKSLTKLNASKLSVSKLPESIGDLNKLVELNLWGNKKLETLPDTICKLRALEVLRIDDCSNVKALPVKLGNIESLQKLSASSLSVSKLPDSIGSLAKLVELDLYDNKNLETLPDTMCNLRSLETLSIESCEKLQALPDELWKIPRLRELNACGVKLLRKLSDIGSGQIALSLQELDLSFSRIIALPSGFSQLSNLQSLHLNRCKSLERLPNLSNLERLEELELAFCSGLTNIQGLEDLISIRRLGLRGCTGLTHRHLPKRLFKVYSEFGHRINVHVSAFMDQKTDPQWLDWIIESPYWTCESSESSEAQSTTVYADLLPNESHNFMGIILCFQRRKYTSWVFDFAVGDIVFSVKNTTSGFIWRSGVFQMPLLGSLMVIVPKSIFSVTDDDHRIELTIHSVEIVGIHLLYNTENETIEDVVEKHVIEIDALKLIDPVLLDIFLDIACFFIGWQKKKVVQILKTYYTNVDHHIDILKTRCLLKINKSDRLEMDDLFQDLGRKLAHNNSLEESEKLSRLWLLTDIYDALKKHKGTEVIEGIVPRTAHHNAYWDRDDDALTGESFTLEAFKKMRKLRFLYLRKVHLTGSFEQTFQDLRWLCWDWCPLKCLPSEFYPPELVILELRHSNIRTMWELNMVPHVFEKLKTLDMSGSEDLTSTPDFTKLPCLETVHLEGCKSLEEVHISIGNLVRLVSLDLHGCVKLRSLPDTICNLRALEVLDMHDCSGITTLPSGISELSNLKVLNLKDCHCLLSIPNLSNLKHLEYLNLEDCSGLTEIQGLKGLVSIGTLHLNGCNSSLLESIFTESFFQMYCQFGHPIHMCSTEFPDWICQPSECESTMSSDEYCSTMSLNLPPNVSPNYLGMILCIRCSTRLTYYSVTEGMDGCSCIFESYGDKWMVIVPGSKIVVEDGDDKIKLEVGRGANIYGIHLLYHSEGYDSSTGNED